jgi:hypothetical protein
MLSRNLVSTLSLLALIDVACGSSNSTTGTGGSGGKAGSSGGSGGKAGGTAGSGGKAGGTAGSGGMAGGTAGSGGMAGGTAGSGGMAGSTAGSGGMAGSTAGAAGSAAGAGGKAGGTAGSGGKAGGTAGSGGKAGGTAGSGGKAGGTAGSGGMAGGTAGSGGAAGSAAGAGGNGGAAAAPILGSLHTIATIGSTVDPNNSTAIDPTGSSTNPYGLVIAPVTAGLITAGDLVVCNFNNGPNTVAGRPAPNTQGQGTTVVGLHPVASAADAGVANPYHIAQSASLLGCSSLSMFPDSSFAATAFSADMVPAVAPSGTVSSPFAADNLAKPWGSAYVAAANGQPAALYVSDATGSINRITLNSSNAQTAFARVVTGFCVSGSVAGMTNSLHAPSGLTYDAKKGTLYIVDTSSYSVVALADVSSIPANSITAHGGNCNAGPPTATPTFTGPSASSASVIASPNSPNGGQQFNAPISAALLLNGNVVVGNADQDLMVNDAGTNENLLFEISPTAGIVGSKQLDSGSPGALFGIAAGPDSKGNQLIYFNDDNDNTVKVLSK